jgi:hypothetical protein
MSIGHCLPGPGWIASDCASALFPGATTGIVTRASLLGAGPAGARLAAILIGFRRTCLARRRLVFRA